MMFRVFLLVSLLCGPATVRAQTWTLTFGAGETELSTTAYGAAREIGDRVRADPGLWSARVSLPPETAPPDGRDVWRLRAVLVELARQGIAQTRTDNAGLVFADTTPAFDPVPSTGRIVVDVERLIDDPSRLFHRRDPVVRFASGDAEISPEARFRIAFGILGPGLEAAVARVNAYSDTSGEFEANMRLSEARAESLARDLIRLGVSADRIETQAHGETALSKPSADGVSEPDNRRATVTLIWPVEPAR